MDAGIGQTLVAIAAGIGLSAACGFRVFVPLLALSIGAHLGYVHPGKGWEWVGSVPAMVALSAATVTEIAAYYVPWLDHALDTVTTPMALVAGTLATASLVPGEHPLLKWSLAIIAGGGAAGTVQLTTVAARAISGGTTGGLGNPVVSTIENVGSTVLAVLAIVIPILAFAIAAVIVYLCFRFARKIIRKLRGKREAPAAEEAAT